MKKALLLCASHNDLGLVRALRKLGYYIICTGNIPGLVGEKFVNEYIQADYSDKERILNIAKENRIDVICQNCNDYGVYTAAYVAEKLGLPGYDSYDTTLLLHNKDRFKRFAEAYGIETIKSHMFESDEEALNWLRTSQYPVIIKPVDASAGNGISKIEGYNEAKEAVEKAFLKSREGRIIIEKFITGSQHGFCTFLLNKKVIAYCTNNEYSIVNPFRVEIDTFPAANQDIVKERVIGQIEKMAEILNLKDGIFHLQYIMDNDVPRIIEVMRRVPGNMYTVPASLLTELDWDYWETRARCGLSCEKMPKHVEQEGFFAYKAILSEHNGRIKEIKIPPNIEKYVVFDFMLKSVDDIIENYKSEPIGFLFMMFESYEKMQKVLISDYANDIVEVENLYE
ncbi:MAG: ATP-grasp domain-containing protein [Lachnospiraceae bacterium]